MNRDPLAIDSYLLGDLSAAEVEQLERTAVDDIRLRERIDSGRDLVALLGRMEGDAWTPRPAPPLAMATLADRSSTRARPRRQRAWLAPRVGVALAGSVAMIAVGALGTIGIQQLGKSDSSGGSSVRLAAVGNLDPNAVGDVRLAADGRSATVAVSGLKPSGGDEYYEMWLMNDSNDLVSAGGFRVGADGQAKVEVPMPAKMEDYRYFDISLERTDDSPGHSGKSVVRSGPIGGNAVALAGPPVADASRTAAEARQRPSGTPRRNEEPKTASDPLISPGSTTGLQQRRVDGLDAGRALRPARKAPRAPISGTKKIICSPLTMFRMTICTTVGPTGTVPKGISGRKMLSALAASFTMFASLGTNGASAGFPPLPAGCAPNADRTSVVCSDRPASLVNARRITGCWTLADGSALCVDPPTQPVQTACDYAAGGCDVVIDPIVDRCVIPGQTSPLQVISSGRVSMIDWPWGRDVAADSRLLASQAAILTALAANDHAFLSSSCDPNGTGLIDPRRANPPVADELLGGGPQPDVGPEQPANRR